MNAVALTTLDHRRVLVIDDEPGVCEVIGEAMKSVGLKAVCVHSDRKAYELLPTLPTFSAVIVDVNLGPGTTGFDVARFARQIIADVAVIYVTGEASWDSFKAFGVPEAAFVAKPFTREELTDAVRSRIPAND
jgi:CheY-like chemotaxis protein